MSTRCQVHVHASGLDDEEKMTLYHQTDGYPDHMLPCIAKARLLAGGSYEAGRPGKAASYLCAADPGTMEPEVGHGLHGDIAYFYDVTVVNKSGGSMGEKDIEWIVKVYHTPDNWWHSRKTRRSLILESEHVFPLRTAHLALMK